uniref:Leucine rich repeats and calponin homology domain containing 2 n=1 Tax=Seriola dumerili TaxID=41447 RepID=A0A3B4U4Q2_SERDU
MASSQGGVGAVTALQSHHYSSGPHWSPGISQFQQHQQQHHTARSLDRALDDAVCSGILNLSGRKLREYPGMSYDLTDTTQAADLSKNRLTEIPPEVCLFAPLESLNLYHNCIKCIPEAIINLQMLTYLDIRNLLSVLPKYLFNLPLKVLLVSNNKLVSIPEEIGKAKELMELDVSCNEIQVLPAQVGRLHALRELNIRKNCLHMLPELADLPLIRLDFSCNKITEIPPAYRKLRQLQHIILDNNPMQSPPAQICLKGKVHIFKYLNIQACRMDKKPDTLDLPSLGKRCLPQPLTDMEDFYPSKNHGPDSGIGSDNGDKRLSTTELQPSDDDTVSLHSQVSETARADALSLLSKMDSCKGSDKEQLVEEEDDELKEVLDLRKIAVQLLQQEQQNLKTDQSDSEPKWPEVPPVLNQNEDRRRNKYLRKDYLKVACTFLYGSRQEYSSTDPSFTMRRKMEHLREEMEQIGLLRQNIESRLKVLLPDDVGAALMDGVVLCHLANHICPRSVASIHVPSPAVPKLSMAKCRRNVENFLDACKKLGVPQQDKLCLPHHILEERGLVKVGVTVQALLDLPALKP